MALNILLADDSMTAQNMAKKILSEAGYEVTTVSNGAAALKKIAERTPDLVILDIYMPGYTGLEVCERVKRAAVTSRMPVLLSVGKLEPYREQDATDVRADGVIIKPFEATELVTIVTNVILRASGDSMEVATRLPASSAAIQASPAAEPEPLPVMASDYMAELANPVPQTQDAGPVFTYSPTTVSNGDYSGTPLPPVEEKLLTMAAPAAAASFATPGFRTAESDSSMPFMMDQLLKADESEKAAAEDSFHHFSGPVLDVSPVEPATEEVEHAAEVVEHATEEIETIEIPAPEPDAGTILSSQEAAPAETTASSTGLSPEELTAIEVEAFLQEHAAGAGPELTSTTGLDFDKYAPYPEGAGAAALWPDDSSIGFNEPVATANATPVPSVENQVAPVEIPQTQPEHAAPETAESANQPVAPEMAENANQPVVPMSAESANQPVAPVSAESATQPVAPMSVESANQPVAPMSVKSDNQPVFEVEPPTTPASAPAVEPEPVAQEPAVQLDVEEAVLAAGIAAAGITVAAAASPVFAPAAETPVAVTDVAMAQNPEPQSVPVPSSPAKGSETEAATSETPTEDFMFSVPMMLEGTAAMSLPELPDLGRVDGSEPAGSSTFGAPKYATEAARPAGLDEAAIAGAVQRVMDRLKPQIVAEIVRELGKHKQ